MRTRLRLVFKTGTRPILLPFNDIHFTHPTSRSQRHQDRRPERSPPCLPHRGRTRAPHPETADPASEGGAHVGKGTKMMSSACEPLLTDTTAASPSARAAAAAFHDLPFNRSAALLLSHLDGAQIASVAILQLLLTFAGGGDGGTLVLVHTDDWPELRLAVVGAPRSSRDADQPTTLPTTPTRPTTAATSRLLDYRCHVPGGALGTAFARPVASCLRALAGASVDASRSVGTALGVTSEAGLEALTRTAQRLVERGMEAAVVSLSAVADAALRPPCCTLVPCGADASPLASTPLPPIPGRVRHI